MPWKGWQWMKVDNWARGNQRLMKFFQSCFFIHQSYHNVCAFRGRSHLSSIFTNSTKGRRKLYRYVFRQYPYNHFRLGSVKLNTQLNTELRFFFSSITVQPTWNLKTAVLLKCTKMFTVNKTRESNLVHSYKTGRRFPSNFVWLLWSSSNRGRDLETNLGRLKWQSLLR